MPTSVLPDAALIDANLVMPDKHQKLHQLAIKYNGACTKKFSQGSDDRAKGLGYWYHGRFTGGARWGGVCKALSVYWIAFHANDEDFWGWLMKDGWGQAENAAQIIQLHGNYKGGRGGMSKDRWTADRLAKAGVIEKKGISDGSTLSINGTANQTSGTGRSYLAGFLMAQAMAPNFNAQRQGYRQLSIHGPPGGGHAVAAWVAQDALFFDPNYGEFWFEKVADFRQWFGHFWEVTGYGEKYKGGYNINLYAKKAF